ncbi:MAG TPA: GNAT family N-acetyltransferase [Ignavibacteria bacterium]|nr:GNAT family N-acetyltransferase [Ignavibacteria bacterium]
MINVIKTEIGSDLEWKEFLRNQYNLFFDFRFNSYNDTFNKNIKWHHLKFKDSETKKILAVMIGCEKITDGKLTYVSCEGVSFGGFLWKKKINLINFLEITESLLKYLHENNFSKCILKNPPFLYNRNPNEETEYALIKNGFWVSSVSVSNIIDLEKFEFRKISEPKKRSIRKTLKKIDVEIVLKELDTENFKVYYDILYNNRALKNVKPTHSLEELIFLKKNFPNDIVLFSAIMDSKVVAICILFSINKEMILNFYLADDENYKTERVSEYILYKSVEWAKENNFKYYDTGTSDSGGKLLEGLFAFKKNFLANGYLRKSYEIDINQKKFKN